MRSFADLDHQIGSVPAGVVMDLRTVDVGRGSEALFLDQLPALLTELANRARISSITASSAIEGVVVPDRARAVRIIDGRATSLRTRSERELAGYRIAADYLFGDEWQPLTVGLILHLHRLLYSETPDVGGRFKSTNNLVVEQRPDGSREIRFKPVPAVQTETYVSELVARYRAAQLEGRHHPVLLVGLFVLDLLVIHPFDDGNGRVARVLTNALLQDAGYWVTRYISMEQAVAESADEYYSSLHESTRGWHDGTSDSWPWLSYFVHLIADAYEVFSRRAASERPTGTKQDRVREFIVGRAAPIFRLADIRAEVPGVSDPTIRLVLGQLKAEGIVAPDGTGRGAVWRKSPPR